MEPLGRIFVFSGLLLVVVGLLLYAAPSVPFLGKLPGDLRIERPGFRFYFPITTCILISVGVSFFLGALSKVR